MILSDSEIKRRIGSDIIITPYNESCVGAASYDVHLGDTLATYDGQLDAKYPTTISDFAIPDDGFILVPGVLYLGFTVEYTETHNLVPILEGKSSIGRLGISIHITAGFGDPGFCGHWTLEMTCVEPVRIYAGMPIGQIVYNTLMGEVDMPYNRRGTSKYNGQGASPVASKMFMNFVK